MELIHFDFKHLAIARNRKIFLVSATFLFLLIVAVLKFSGSNTSESYKLDSIKPENAMAKPAQPFTDEESKIINDAANSLRSDNYVEILNLLGKYAMKGDATAQYVVGNMFFNGQGVPQDKAEGLKWWRLSAEQGIVDAQIALKNYYANSNTVDYPNVFRWAYLAAQDGDSYAQYLLGIIYRDGLGVDRNLKQSITWLQMAAKQKHEGAIKELKALTTNGSTASNNLCNDIIVMHGSVVRLATGTVLTDFLCSYSEVNEQFSALPVRPITQEMYDNYKSFTSRSSDASANTLLGVGGVNPLIDSPSHSVRDQIASSTDPMQSFNQANIGVINGRTGEFYARSGPGYVGGRDGTYYAPAGPNGMINTRTGAFTPLY